MIDKEELRRLAQAIPDEPSPGEFSTSFIRRRKIALIEFEDAASPAAVIEMLDEIERLRAVFDAARAMMKYGGPERFGKAWYALDAAVQAVLLADQGGER